MREILFRGKRIDNGDWVYGCYVEMHDHEGNVTHHISPPWCKVAPKTVGQYTGLTDKNGKKIFEGDVLLCEYPSSVWRGYVVWGKGCFSVKICSGKNCPALDIVLHYGSVEVISNIHDNPELIGGVGE